MKTTLFIALLIGAPFAALQIHAQETLQHTRDTLDKWVQTRQIISKETSDWRIEASILKDTHSLLTNELQRLTRSLEALKSSATAADETRISLADTKENISAAAQTLEANIGTLETKLKTLIPTLPPPLVKRIQPLFRRLPDDPSSSSRSLSERVQNIIDILSQADKFNTTLTVTSESREIESGKSVEVRTLYWGLATAYYVDASGEYAGIGVPGPRGWQWPRIEGAGPQIKRLLAVYEGNEAIQFIEVPARIH